MKLIDTKMVETYEETRGGPSVFYRRFNDGKWEVLRNGFWVNTMSGTADTLERQRNELFVGNTTNVTPIGKKA